MTTKQLAAMQEGKRLASERRQAAWCEQRKVFVAWCEAEAVALAGRAMMEDEHGRYSDEWRAADADWRAHWAAYPVVPPDHAPCWEAAR